MLQDQMGRFEEYLDGALDEAARRDVETQIASDPRAVRVVRALRSHRALRAAALASYAPSAGESASQASHLLALCEHEALRPVGRIGAGIRRWAAVAAAVIIVAGSFMAGRTTAPAQVVTRYVNSMASSDGSSGENAKGYSVAFVDPNGAILETHTYSTSDERDSALREPPGRLTLGDSLPKGHF